MRAAAIAMATLLAAAPAAAEDCTATFKPARTTGAITSMGLYNFGEHWELQFETPNGEVPQNLALGIDGAEQRVFFSIGMDDVLFVVSSEEGALNLSKTFLTNFANGSSLSVGGVMPGGKEEIAEFKLAGSAAAVKRLAGCR